MHDEDWAEIFGEAANIVDRANKAYGDSTVKAVKCLGILYPDGISPDKYYDALATLRIFDKLSRISIDKDAFGESPWRDLIGYGALAYREELRKNPNRER